MEFVPSSCPHPVILTIPSSKTDPFRRVSIIIEVCRGVDVCSDCAQNLLVCAAASKRHLFFSQDGSDPLSRGHFINTGQVKLACVGFDASKSSGHSFRRGAASSAAAWVFNDYEIQQLGRWRSDS